MRGSNIFVLLLPLGVLLINQLIELGDIILVLNLLLLRRLICIPDLTFLAAPRCRRRFRHSSGSHAALDSKAKTATCKSTGMHARCEPLESARA